MIGLLLCVGPPVAPLEEIAKQGAAALELANDYTDVIEAAPRRKPTTAAAEVQYVADLNGGFTELEGPIHPALGAGTEPPTFETSAVTLDSSDRLVLVTDGITERTVTGGGRFGIDGVRRAILAADAPTASAGAMAIHRAVTECSTESLRGRRHARRPRRRLSHAAGGHALAGVRQLGACSGRVRSCVASQQGIVIVLPGGRERRGPAIAGPLVHHF